MGVPRFNPNIPYGQVYQHQTAKFYQHGVYFSGDGLALRQTGDDTYEIMEGAMPPLSNGSAAASAELKRTEDPRIAALLVENQALYDRIAAIESRLMVGGPVLVGTAPMTPKPSHVNVPAADMLGQFKDQLHKMPFGKLKKLYKQSVNEMDDGPEKLEAAALAEVTGSKQKMIDYLVEHNSP